MSCSKPCKNCPWIKKGQPDISDEVRKAMESGQWFCCHVNMGTCFGAQKLYKNHINNKKQS